MNSRDYSTNENEPRPGGLLPGSRSNPVPPTPGQESRPVDQIAVRKLGGFNFITPMQWVELPREERARLIKGELVTFLNQGEPVPTRSALLFLRALAQQRAESTAYAPTDERLGFDPPPPRRPREA